MFLMHSPTIALLCPSQRLFIDDDTFPLISDAELAKYKSLMEEDFRKNQLKPGDVGFEYDKQVPAPAAAAAPLPPVCVCSCQCVH
jgi:hypothetical protein